MIVELAPFLFTAHTMLVDQITPDYSPEVRGRICKEVMLSAMRTIDAQRDRDEMFLTWDQQAEGDPWWAGIGPRWRGACDIEDPITDELLFETVGAMIYVQQQQDWYQVTDTEGGDGAAQAAASLEAFMNDIVSETKLNTVHLYDLAVNAARHSYGVLVVEWVQEVETQYRPVCRNKKTNHIVEPESPEYLANPDDYKIIEEGTPVVVKDGISLRVPYTGDVYLDHAGAQSFKEAERIIERFDYTAADLWRGIKKFGFDQEEVVKLIKAGPTMYEQRTYRNERDEIEGIESEEGTWEVFAVVGRPPLLWDDDKPLLDDEDLDRDWQWMICPSRNICFKFAPSGYNRRIYAKYPLRGRPGRMIGHSVPSMLSPLQQEGSSAFRFRIDFRDLYMSSPLLVPETHYDDLQRFSLYAGALIPYPVNPPLGPSAIQPLPYNPAGYQASMADAQDIRGRAAQLFSADARGPAQVANRTATEAGQAAAGADEKLDLFLMNFHMGVEETGEIILSHYQQFSGPDGVSRTIGSKQVELSPEMLKKKFRISATGSSENASPMIRLQRTEMLAKVASQDPILMQKMQQGDMSGIYEVMSRVYRALGIRNPESIDGKEPGPPPTPDMILQVVLSAAAQFAQAGDPGAAQIMQIAQQAMMSAGGGQQGQGGPGGQGGQGQTKTTISLNYKDLAPNEQDALAARVGLPPAHQGGGQPGMNGAGGPPQQPVYA